MNKRSFFRGFGTGVLFTAVILGISCLIRTSDSFVASRAEELGMIYAEDDEDTIVSEASKTAASAEPTATAASDSKKNTDSQSTAQPTATPKSSSSTTEASDTSDKSSDDETTMESEKEEIEKDLKEEAQKLTIHSGDWSSDVSQELEDMGIIDSAQDFDSYLERNGYGTSINAGTYSVSVDDTYAELAKKITGQD